MFDSGWLAKVAPGWQTLPYRITEELPAIRSEPVSKARCWVPLLVWQVRSALVFRAQLASASATPDVAHQCPHNCNYGHEYEDGEGNEHP